MLKHLAPELLQLADAFLDSRWERAHTGSHLESPSAQNEVQCYYRAYMTLTDLPPWLLHLPSPGQPCAKAGSSATTALSYPALCYCLIKIFRNHPPRLSMVPLTCAALVSIARSATGLTTLSHNCSLTTLSHPLDSKQLKGSEQTVPLAIPGSPALRAPPGTSRLAGDEATECVCAHSQTHTCTHIHADTPLSIALCDIFPSTQKVEFSKVRSQAVISPRAFRSKIYPPVA